MKKRILFICAGNTCRSPMAQHLFLKTLGGSRKNGTVEYEVLSAGLFAYDGLPASQEAIEVMTGEGIDLSGHESAQLTGKIIADADLILAMTEGHCQILMDSFPQKKDCIFTISEYAGMGGQDISDPYGSGRQAYINTLQQLKEALDKVAARVIHEII